MSNVFHRKGYLLLVPVLAALMLVLMGGTAQAEDSHWRARFWNNKNFDGDPVVERTDKTIDFNWGEGAPDSRVSDDNFSAKWNRQVHFDEGTYRFTATMDDAMRVYLDGNKIIDAWWDSQEHTMTQDVFVTGGDHDLKVEYYEAGGQAVARFNWQLIQAGGQGTGGGGQFFPNWKAEYFNNTSLSGAPALVRDDRYLNHNWGAGSPAPGVINSDNFSARWTRSYAYPAGNYHISLTSDDGSRLYINNQLIIDNWGVQAPTTKTAGYYHAGGNVNVLVEYFEQAQNASIDVHVGSESTPVIPPSGGSGGSGGGFGGGSGTGGACTPPAPNTAYVNASSLNFREGPGTQYPVVTYLNQCQVVRLTGYTDAAYQWVQVVLPDGRTAWANNKYLVMGTPINQLAVTSS